MGCKTTFAFLSLHLPAIVGRLLAKDVFQELRKGSYYDQPMKNHEDVSYTASIKIGGHQLDAVLDSGSFDLEVVSTRCGLSCAGKGQSKYYNREKSATYNAGDLIQLTRYESGDVLAQLGTDKVQIGPLIVPDQQFWEVVYAELPILSYGDFQVILGVGPPGVNQDEVKAGSKLAKDMADRFRAQGFEVPANFSARRYVEELPQQKTLLEKIGMRSFSVCLERASGAVGHFIWNDRSASQKASMFREVPVQGKYSWSSVMTSVKLAGADNKMLGCEKPCAAIIDSGTSLLMVPTSVYNLIFDKLKDLGADCDRLEDLPNLVFNLGGATFELPASAYIGFVDEAWASLDKSANTLDSGSAFGSDSFHSFQRSLSQSSDGKVCNMLLGKLDATTQMGDMWILGMPFFRSYYVNFQLGEDLRDMGARKMTVAAASSDCSPVAAAGLYGMNPGITPTYVNSKKLQIPRWVRKAHKDGHMVI